MNGTLISARLACIDAPETVQGPDGQQSRQSGEDDRSLRPLVAEVFKDININLVLVEDGQAFVYRQ
jgi:endonuclease YncB( thermonuclease family)